MQKPVAKGDVFSDTCRPGTVPCTCVRVPWHHGGTNLGWYVVSGAFSQNRKVVKMNEGMLFRHVLIYGLSLVMTRTTDVGFPFTRMESHAVDK